MRTTPNQARAVAGAVLLTLGLVSLASCAKPPRAESKARLDPSLVGAVAERQRAVADGDADRFVALVDAADPEFALERERWFEYRRSAEIRDYRLEAEAAYLPRGAGSGGGLYVVISQSYRIGPGMEERQVRSVDLYRKPGRDWLYAGPAFAELGSDHFAVKYALPPEAMGESAEDRERRLAPAARVAGHAEKAWSVVLASYGETPPAPVTLKLYPDRELLRQDSKITIPRLFNGWGEPGEPIKLWLNPDPKRDFTAVLAHELVHKVTLAEAANQCSWFAEGLATSLGSFSAMGGSYLDGGFHKKEDYARSIGWLEGQDPETIEGDEAWWLYGGMAGTVIDFMRQAWGAESPRRVVGALAKAGRPEGAYVYALRDAAYRDDLRAAVREALGVEWKEFDERWLAWIQSRP